MERKSGILMHISSLPSPWGIGTLGQSACRFAEFLRDAGQTYWQVLPLGPTGYGDSPYQSFSSFAGNPYFIDLDLLARDGLLEHAEYEHLPWGQDPGFVDYGAIYRSRFPVLRKAYRRGWNRDSAQVDAFRRECPWLGDYALFMAVKQHFDMLPLLDWPDDSIRLRKPEALERYGRLLEDDVNFFIYLQYLFFRQWDALRDYVHSLGIRLIGDLPIYVSMDSAEVWTEPEAFRLCEGVPKEVSGVPPDSFSDDGQLWGNPLYDYDRMAQDGFGWWVRRMRGIHRLVDIVRIDHFRGFESFWAVPYGDTSAKNGHWCKGPGMSLIRVLRAQFPDMPIIAEDLGYLTPEVRQLLKDSGFPGMKVLEFAFDTREPSDYYPHNFDRNCVCYVGTHDNETIMQWKDSAAPEDVAEAVAYLGLNREEGFHWGILRGAMASVADTSIVQMQDVLGLGAESRMNAPGIPSGNWRWRLTDDTLTPAISRRLREMTARYGRL